MTPETDENGSDNANLRFRPPLALIKFPIIWKA